MNLTKCRRGDYADELRVKNPDSTIKMAMHRVTFKSEMLTVVGRDVKNQMYPVAWAIVEGECTDS
ncbi:hypothetical protein Gotri_014794 [Gossypium trilobum]|uniref:Uncharacterized protein n=1 Tax=Gossypium trilobum TaxID=34281 RepID=A0A7J9DXX5_9ROSI|nr:hypothetical protein [Gossypium trilobum]